MLSGAQQYPSVIFGHYRVRSTGEAIAPMAFFDGVDVMAVGFACSGRGNGWQLLPAAATGLFHRGLGL